MVLKNISTGKKDSQPHQHFSHQRADASHVDRLTIAIEELASTLSWSSMNQLGRIKLMSYEEASEATTLGRSTLESLVKTGRLREGRHYIKEGSRVLFHPNLIDLMFEDKLILSGVEKNKVPERKPTSKRKSSRDLSQNRSVFNSNYN